MDTSTSTENSEPARIVQIATVSEQSAAIDELIALARHNIRVFDQDLSQTGWSSAARVDRLASFLREVRGRGGPIRRRRDSAASLLGRLSSAPCIDRVLAGTREPAPRSDPLRPGGRRQGLARRAPVALSGSGAPAAPNPGSSALTVPPSDRPTSVTQLPIAQDVAVAAAPVRPVTSPAAPTRYHPSYARTPRRLWLPSDHTA